MWLNTDKNSSKGVCLCIPIWALVFVCCICFKLIKNSHLIYPKGVCYKFKFQHLKWLLLFSTVCVIRLLSVSAFQTNQRKNIHTQTDTVCLNFCKRDNTQGKRQIDRQADRQRDICWFWIVCDCGVRSALLYASTFSKDSVKCSRLLTTLFCFPPKL